MMLTTEQIRDRADCPVCGSIAGQACDPEQLKGRSANHSERAKAARRATPTVVSQRR